MMPVGHEKCSGLYMVTLNNADHISANAHDPRMADTSVRVNAMNVKVGKALNFSIRRQGYYQTFGAENVNFQPLVFVDEDVLPFAERCVLGELAPYRLKGPSGRTTEWLVGIDAGTVKQCVLAVLRSQDIQHLLAAGEYRARSSGDEKRARMIGADIKAPSHKERKTMEGFKTSERNAAAETLRCMADLKARDFPEALFPKLHHFGASFEQHEEYCKEKAGRGSDFVKGSRGETNRNVLRRLQDVRERANRCENGVGQITHLDWEKLVREAEPPLPRKTAPVNSEAGGKGTLT